MEPELDFTVWATDDPQPHSSVEAHVAFKVLEELAPDNAKAYHDLIMKAYFADNRDISDPGILTQLAVEAGVDAEVFAQAIGCLLYTSPSPRDQRGSRMPSSA